MRIALIHGDRLYRESLEFYLAQQEELAVVYSAAIFEVGSNPCRCSPPELVLLEFGLCVERRAVGGDWFGANEVSPKLLIVGVPDSEEEILHCIETVGASGYLLKDASLDDLRNNIEAIKRGETICSPRISGLAFSRVSRLAHENGRVREGINSGLTRRENQIVKLVDEGLTNKEIAVHLHIEVSTVKNHIHNILDKLEVQNRYSAAKYLKELGLIHSSR